MSHKKKAEETRGKILQLVREYYASAFQKEKFVPCKTQVPYAGRVFDEKELVLLVEAALEFWLTHGRFSTRFEKELASYLGLDHCLFVNSGSSANLIAFMALTSPLLGERAIHRGDEVITVAAAFPTTVAPIIQYGAVPVFVDVEIPSYNVSVNAIEAALSSRTKAVMLAHTLGNPFDIDKVKAFCVRNDLWLIEDNCDALGSLYGGRLTGTFGDVGTSSFYPPHHMTTGEGGAVYTDNKKLAAIMCSLRDWGRDCVCLPGQDNSCGHRFSGTYGELPPGYDHKYVYSHLGYNLKATDLQASIGIAQLEKLPGFIETRKNNWTALRKGLQDLEGFFVLPEAAPGSDPSWFGFVLTVRPGAPFQREEIIRHLESKGIQTRPLFAGNLLRHPCISERKGGELLYRVWGELENTEIILQRTFWVGVYPGMSEEMISFIVRTIREFAGQ